jgi:hypothetical protein
MSLDIWLVERRRTALAEQSALPRKILALLAGERKFFDIHICFMPSTELGITGKNSFV